ncbi:Uncharacterised protein [Mycobacteroides abscessus subsp. abscessus]|nr:Uncharacterised protein [Mycobacteroides abscessus subsp. abscessus]
MTGAGAACAVAAGTSAPAASTVTAMGQTMSARRDARTFRASSYCLSSSGRSLISMAETYQPAPTAIPARVESARRGARSCDHR